MCAVKCGRFPSPKTVILFVSARSSLWEWGNRGDERRNRISNVPKMIVNQSREGGRFCRFDVARVLFAVKTEEGWIAFGAKVTSSLGKVKGESDCGAGFIIVPLG